MVIAIIDAKGEADRCADLTQALLPRPTCLITPTVRDIWRTDDPVPALSGVLVNGTPEDLPPSELATLEDMARRFPLAYTAWGEERLGKWGDRCLSFRPQHARQPDRLPWERPLEVEAPWAPAPLACSTGNVSLGGVLVRDARPGPSAGDRVVLRFPTLGLKASAEVRWVKSEGYGCQFAEADRWVAAVLVNAARGGGKPAS